MKYAIDKSLKDITKQDLEKLVKNRIPESSFLDYKKENYGKSNTDKKELLKDVSAFANANGGELIIGIQEDKYNQAGILCGIKSENIADDITRLEQIIHSGLEPKLSTFQTRYLELAKNKYVIIIRVERSPFYPHMISFQRANKFYIRRSDRNLLLDAYELRNIFIKSETIIDDIRKYNEQRVAAIYADRGIAPLIQGGNIVLNFIPYDALSNKEAKIDLSKQDVKLRMNEQRINFDGVLGYTSGEKGITSYCQLYRNGIIEFATASNHIFGDIQLPKHKNKTKVIWGGKGGYEYYLIRKSRYFLKLLKTLNIKTPVYLFLTLTDTKGYKILYSSNAENPKLTGIIDRNLLVLPEIEIKDLDTDFKKTVKSVFDIIWNSCGEPGSKNYDPKGNWAGKK